MKKLLLLISIILGPVVSIHATNHTEQATTIPATGSLSWFSSLSMKEVQQLVGKKLTLKEKIAVKIFQWKLKKELKASKRNAAGNKGALALLFGILGLVSFFIPGIGPFAALGFGILALVLGRQAKNADPNDGKAKAGIILGWIIAGLFLVALVIVIAFLSTWSFGG